MAGPVRLESSYPVVNPSVRAAPSVPSRPLTSSVPSDSGLTHEDSGSVIPSLPVIVTAPRAGSNSCCIMLLNSAVVCPRISST